MQTQLSNNDNAILVLFDIDYTLYDTDTFKQSNLKTHRLYDEVVDVLSEISSVATLGIFSEGDTSLQQSKLAGCGIEQYFPVPHVHIVVKKEEAIASVFARYAGKKVFIVDDKLPVLRLLKQYMPSLYTVWVKRGIYASVQEPFADFTPDTTIETLTALPEVVRKEMD